MKFRIVGNDSSDIKKLMELVQSNAMRHSLLPQHGRVHVIFQVNGNSWPEGKRCNDKQGCLRRFRLLPRLMLVRMFRLARGTLRNSPGVFLTKLGPTEGADRQSCCDDLQVYASSMLLVPI